MKKIVMVILIFLYGNAFASHIDLDVRSLCIIQEAADLCSKGDYPNPEECSSVYAMLSSRIYAMWDLYKYLDLIKKKPCLPPEYNPSQRELVNIIINASKNNKRKHKGYKWENTPIAIGLIISSRAAGPWGGGW